MVQSCNFTLIDASDYSRRMEKNAYPLVICYNGRDHYVPTKPTTYQHFYAWKTEKELAPILLAGLLVIEEMDLRFVSDEQKEACNELEACIIKHLPTLSPQVNAAHHGMAAQASGRGMCGPFFSRYPLAKFLLLLENLLCLLPPQVHLLPQFPHITLPLKKMLLFLQKRGENRIICAIYVGRNFLGNLL